MTAGVYDIVIEVGATYTLRVTVKAGAPAVARPLTGFTARMQVRKKVSDEVPLLDLGEMVDGKVGLSIPDPLTGAILIEIPASLSTSSIPGSVKTGVYDLEIVSGVLVERVLEGSVTFKPEVTRA